MKRIVFEDISTFIVKYIFHLRFKVALLSRKSRIFNKILTKLLFEDDKTYFIPNNNNITHLETIEVNKTIDKTKNIIFPSDIIKEIIRNANYIVIMNSCLCRTSANCNDYPQNLGCIFLGRATKKISRKYCREVTPDEAINHIDKCNNAGLIHIMGRNKLDVRWMNVGPSDELLTICNCCPCCCLWRVLPNFSDSIQGNFHKLPGISVYCDDNQCILCKKCVDICFVEAITIDDNKIKVNSNCMGCSQCVSNCPDNAMKINYDDNMNYTIDDINNIVNIEK
ncbi:4Fe-4S dicluster domain-containing protein [uncultured Methanosphaera sp.]|uniref:4Fe-4S dicluster domain-containing protein n=1 Tax=uncultured Methanosphaera sp. TaxID=262501 RepID=UPI002595C704|nr:4Fe-4S dicluster domain-containing protein [uncultured Methanosphaera sp.]